MNDQRISVETRTVELTLSNGSQLSGETFSTTSRRIPVRTTNRRGDS